jgi:hypothetical protein
MLRKVLIGVSCLAALSACGSKSMYGGGSAAAPMYTVGGQLSGLTSGATITLMDNGGDSLSPTSNGAFTFKTAMASGSSYAVTVGTQPNGENCMLTNPSGMIGASAVTNVAVSCTATPNPAPASISQSNATAVAAQAILALQSFGNVSTASPGASGSVPASSVALMQILGPRMKAARQGVHPSDTITNSPCAVSGTITEDDSADGTSSSVTFNDCVEAANLTLNGVESFSNLSLTTAPALVTLTASVQENLTVTIGTVTELEVGSFALSAAFTPKTSFVFDLSAVNLAVKISVNGTVLDNEALSNASITLTEDLTISPNQLHTDFAFTLASTALNGSVTAATTATIKRIADPAVMRVYPYTGQFLVTGSNGARIRVTIFGDETYAPPAGQGQVEIEIDTGGGTFGTPIWVNWATLAGFAATGSAATFSIGGSISGLPAGTGVTLLDNGTDPLTVGADGTFKFLTPLATGSAYAVTVWKQPTGATCTVTDASGTVASANVTNVSVTCQ